MPTPDTIRRSLMLPLPGEVLTSEPGGDLLDLIECACALATLRRAAQQVRHGDIETIATPGEAPLSVLRRLIPAV